jgi:hypothetical protein
MKLVVLALVLVIGGCSKKKVEDKAAPASVEQPAPPAAEPSRGSAVEGAKLDQRSTTPADDGGELERKMKTPADDGGEDKKPVPADDGGEAMKKACGKTEDCPGTHDCCNGFCIKKGTTKHALECKLPEGKL